jgi:hypothetical protein
MRKIKLLALAMPLVISTNLFSQLTIDGEFRPRLMIDGGYKTIKLQSDPTLVYISQRSRINFGYKSDKLETYFSLQDVHFWGDDDMYSSTGVSGNSKGINLHQAWISIKPTSAIAVKIGRQQFNYDDQRFLSARNWGEYQVTYDALLFSWVKSTGKLDIASSWNNNGSTDALYPKGKMKTLNFIRYEQGVGKVTLSAIALVSGITKADTLTDVALTSSYGLNIVYKVKSFDARLTGYYQSALNNVNGNISSYCLSAFVRKSLFNDKASAGIGADIYSGNDGTITDATYKKTQHKFNSLYGNRHSVLGYMDFFTSIPDQGIQDYMVKTEYKLTKEVLLQADYHLFYLNNKGYDMINTDQLAQKLLGSELDFTLQWKVMKDVTLQTGYSFYLTTDTVEKWKKVYNKDVSFPQFAYVMLTVKPTFFKGE